MTRATILGGAFAALLLLVLAGAAGYLFFHRVVRPPAASFPGALPASAPAGTEAHPAAEAHQGFLYGRITTVEGATHEGRLRFGGVEEAFWDDYFNGFKEENPWAAHVPPERLTERRPVEVFGVTIARREHEIDLGRPFVARFGDLERIEVSGRDLRAALKSGTVVELDRFNADDIADGVRVWDGERGVVDLEEWRIRTIELLPTPSPTPGSVPAPYRLHGTVRTRHGDFTGFVQWDRNRYVGSDELVARTAEGELGLRFDTIRSIARSSRDGLLVTLLDGREIALPDSRRDGPENLGIYVHDRRYGRVLVSWDAFERADFGPGGSGPAYGDFPPGSPLTGRVTTRAGRRLAGRLVYDLDEGETTDTLDADDRGLHYTLPFGLIATIAPAGPEGPGGSGATVTLHDGEELHLEPTGDLRPENAGLLVFVGGRERPEYVPWADVQQIELHRPPATYPPLAR